ncbi:MAG: putative zinc-binding metallopeptidase [Steroidobacter sp.]
MKNFHCNHCDQVVFFESVSCVNCGRLLAYLPDRQSMGALDAGQNGAWIYRSKDAESNYRLCINYSQNNVCNWAVPVGDDDEACVSCRLTQFTPELADNNHRQAWFKLETAKRRLVYTLQQLKLPLLSKRADTQHGLAFEFRAETPNQPALTGHANGLITINIAEADDAIREQRRANLHEAYRTLLGHFRHESGHYYWDRLISNTENLQGFRALFGDEQQDYASSLQRHYEQGAPGDWQTNFISAYASSHPWEDWAENWAHYLHMIDVTETAVSCGLTLRPRNPNDPLLESDSKQLRRRRFDAVIDAWFSVTYVLNSLNRSLGQQDAYPFELSDPTIEKLRFVHQVIEDHQAATSSSG